MGRVNLTRIYTRLGDDGATHLGDMSRVPKTDARIEAYGTVDELNAQIGATIALAEDLAPTLRSQLRRVQNDLFDLGADLCLPPGSREGKLSIEPEQTAWLEKQCDALNEQLQPLHSFVLPGGTVTASMLHVCRTVCRRAERRVLAVDAVNPEVPRYLNRLSDYFFILSRTANGDEEVLWEPGESQSDDGEEA